MISQPAACRSVARKVYRAGVQMMPRVLATDATPW
jgi:hypothetical protein